MLVCWLSARLIVPWLPAVSRIMFFNVRCPSGSPKVAGTLAEPTFTLTNWASMAWFSVAVLLMSAFMAKRLSPSFSVTGSTSVSVTSAAASASAIFWSSCQSESLLMLASVPFRLNFMLPSASASILPSVFTLTMSRSCSVAPMDTSAVVGWVASTVVTGIGFDGYSETVLLKPL